MREGRPKLKACEYLYRQRRSIAVPAYAVFTDAELAEMSRLNELTSQNVQKIEGIAEKRMNKYGVSLIEKYRKSTENEKVQPSDTTNSGNG